MSEGIPPALSVVFDPAARDELAEAVAWYDQQRAGLGDEFLSEVKRTITHIREHPLAWPSLSARSRRCRLARFPYGVLYQVSSDQIRILTIAHLHRRPDYWSGREDR